MSDIKKPSRNFTIDFFRIVFSVLIVALHSSPFIEYNEYVSYFVSQTFSRLAVPFFATVTGYYFFSQIKKNYLKSIKNLLFLYVPWSLVSFIYDIAYWKGTKIECFIHLVKTLFLYGWQQLWYMLAIIYLLIILFLAEKIGIKNKYLFFLSIPCLLLGIMRYAYGLLFEKIGLFKSVFGFIDKIEQKNWFLLIFPFFMLGWLINQIKNEKIIKYSGLLCLISVFGFSSEVVLTTLFNLKDGFKLCIFSYFVILFLMLFCLSHPGNAKPQTCKMCSRVASCIYVAHQVILSFCFRMEISETPIFFIAIVIPLILAFVVLKIDNKTLNKLI